MIKNKNSGPSSQIFLLLQSLPLNSAQSSLQKNVMFFKAYSFLIFNLHCDSVLQIRGFIQILHLRREIYKQ